MFSSVRFQALIPVTAARLRRIRTVFPFIRRQIVNPIRNRFRDAVVPATKSMWEPREYWVLNRSYRDDYNIPRTCVLARPFFMKMVLSFTSGKIRRKRNSGRPADGLPCGMLPACLRDRQAGGFGVSSASQGCSGCRLSVRRRWVSSCFHRPAGRHDAQSQ